ncbi:hypothetical protein Cni_G21576 [Canna indica]|uniref:PB1 domain-containing protein n=1 Tax=Canna indica TaxID=4628 RepID=A0AAQ3QKF5_9LILI|nr:hypothetical protein Cni_G21576 [Canna indica]
MVGSSSSASSSCASFGSSFEEDVVTSAKPSGSVPVAIKFLCSYGGKILPRYPDGKLRYVGGDTRILAVDRSVTFSVLQEKMKELCGWGAVALRCKLPTEDIDALVSVKSDEDLANVVEAYDLAACQKIRVFLFPPTAKPSDCKSPAHLAPQFSTSLLARPSTPAQRLVHRISAPSRLTGRYANPAAADFHRHHNHRHYLHGHQEMPKPCHLVHNGSHWQ